MIVGLVLLMLILSVIFSILSYYEVCKIRDKLERMSIQGLDDEIDEILEC